MVCFFIPKINLLEETAMNDYYDKHYLENKDLSLKEKGILAILIMMADDNNGRFSMKDTKKYCKENLGTIRNYVRELEKKGYVANYMERNEKGQYKNIVYVVSEFFFWI